MGAAVHAATASDAHGCGYRTPAQACFKDRGICTSACIPHHTKSPVVQRKADKQSTSLRLVGFDTYAIRYG